MTPWRTAERRPLVSIGVPAFNGEAFLVAAIESALAQAYDPFELIICDDASSDGTESIGRRFAAADPRVRYVRNPRNLGAVRNFRRVVDLSAGTYFTWLAQDDLFTRTDYLQVAVDYLERAPDVVGCTGPFTYYDLEGPGPGVRVDFPELRPDRAWADARREFFIWPPGQLYLALYGVFRHRALAATPFVVRHYRGRPNADCWEMPLFTGLVGLGRIVALPSAERGYRSHTASDAFRISRRTSRLDALLLALWMNLILARHAWQVPAPARERLGLLGQVAGNIRRAHLPRPADYRHLARIYADEHAMLRATARERRRVIAELRQTIADGRRGLLAAGIADLGGDEDRPAVGDAIGGSGDHDSVGSHDPVDDLPPTGLARRSSGGLDRLRALLRPPPPSLVLAVHDARHQIGRLRAICDERLATIRHLDAELRAIREVLVTADGARAAAPS